MIEPSETDWTEVSRVELGPHQTLFVYYYEMPGLAYFVLGLIVVVAFIGVMFLVRRWNRKHT